MKWVRLSARLIIVLWACFWIFFAAGSAIGEGGKADFLVAAVILIVFLGFLYVAWRRPLLAGISLVLIGAVVTGAYLYIDRSNIILLINGLLPLISGFLLFLSRPRLQRV